MLLNRYFPLKFILIGFLVYFQYQLLQNLSRSYAGLQRLLINDSLQRFEGLLNIFEIGNLKLLLVSQFIGLTRAFRDSQTSDQL